MDQDKVHGKGFVPLPLVFLVIFGSYITWYIVHIVIFDPLSRFPGPVWSKFTRIPYWVASLTGQEIYFMHRLHDKYGSVVRMSPTELSYIDAQAWKDIYGYQKGRAENLKAPGFHMMVVGTAEHTRVRRIFSPGFSIRALKQQEPLLRKYNDLLMSKLHAHEFQVMNISKMFNLATFDIMAELSFGEPLGLLEQSKYTAWVQNIMDSIKTLPILQMIKFYPLLNTFFEYIEPRFIKEARIANFRYSADRVDKRLERGSSQPDLWNLVEFAADDEKLSLEEMHANALDFMVAGSETTATLLSALVYLLLTNPDKLNILMREVRGQSADTESLTIEVLAGFGYLNACIQEALRIYPPVPLGIPRAISSNPDRGQIVCGCWVPSGTRVSVHPYAAYHSSANFKNPELFAPERWLGDDTYKDDKRDVLQPFSFGPRNCIGQNLAWHQMRLIAATLLSKFDLELCEESREWIYSKVYTMWEKTPLKVRMRAVEKN
ncbi:hypothetical protein M406DRAFT_291163 [Cryphonectria parasitica EP155]|uniref:Cytochrome P450 n=1 Tax=Cryphonectria parasitica (strain ATCC 38755 / EP155) TaxID=660469 RepID=A0A9P4Y073_CRYP1|nr:uncharacterized protein M406DRAFT_291163 [Cryphonectria parasitica EP155]KAF3764123.1 hypothetical protein M406DRAFT_291163 [Cryphonectria parasitica EP155]